MDTETTEWEATRRRNLRQLVYWTGAWVLTMALGAFGPKFLWNYHVPLSILFVLINALTGIGMMWVNMKYINGLDEMHRKVTLDAMAIALGVGVVGGLSYSLLDIANVITVDAEISLLVILISITYLIAVLVGNRRYA